CAVAPCVAPIHCAANAAIWNRPGETGPVGRYPSHAKPARQSARNLGARSKVRGMKLTKLRLLGFKSFVEPTDFLIEPGLTSVVGPNGCGKSNLVEALRWVMGESSHKSMRAANMDDVIFSGTNNRPARNTAEVGITIDNTTRTAPPQCNEHELLDVPRRIEREQGSTYRINGKEV